MTLHDSVSRLLAEEASPAVRLKVRRCGAERRSACDVSVMLERRPTATERLSRAHSRTKCLPSDPDYFEQCFTRADSRRGDSLRAGSEKLRLLTGPSSANFRA
jgi:hypothetical protein